MCVCACVLPFLIHIYLLCSGDKSLKETRNSLIVNKLLSAFVVFVAVVSDLGVNASIR